MRRTLRRRWPGGRGGHVRASHRWFGDGTAICADTRPLSRNVVAQASLGFGSVGFFLLDLGREEMLLWRGGVEELRQGRCWGNGSLHGAPRSPRSCRVPGRRDQSGAAAPSWVWLDRVKGHLAAVQVWLPRCEACSRMPLSRCHLSTMLRDHSSGSLDNHASLDRTPGPIERRPAFGGPFFTLCAVTIAPPRTPHHLATLWNSELGIFSNISTRSALH